MWYPHVVARKTFRKQAGLFSISPTLLKQPLLIPLQTCLGRTRRLRMLACKVELFLESIVYKKACEAICWLLKVVQLPSASSIVSAAST